MPIFVCDRCGCMDNTACGGNWWIKNRNEEFFNDVENGEALCVECTPEYYKDGTKSEKHGKWHNRFPKEKWDGKTTVMNR